MRSFILASLVWVGLTLGIFTDAQGDVLILANEKRFEGEISLIANDYIEFKTEQVTGSTEWIKIPKQKMLAVVDDNGKIIYPRDKYDENALNYGSVKLRDAKDLVNYRARKRENIANQLRLEKAEKNKYKVAAIIGGLAGLMILTISNGI